MAYTNLSLVAVLFAGSLQASVITSGTIQQGGLFSISLSDGYQLSGYSNVFGSVSRQDCAFAFNSGSCSFVLPIWFGLNNTDDGIEPTVYHGDLFTAGGTITMSQTSLQIGSNLIRFALAVSGTLYQPSDVGVGACQLPGGVGGPCSEAVTGAGIGTIDIFRPDNSFAYVRSINVGLGTAAEPTPNPEPFSLLLVFTGLGALLVRKRQIS